MTTYYASPAGGGSGTSSSPFTIAAFWAVAAAGDTLLLTGTNMLTDGLYRGSSSMIVPTAGLSGTGLAWPPADMQNAPSSNPITIKAINDGGVLIDGEFARVPLQLNGNAWLVIDGINFRSGSGNVAMLQAGASNNIIRRCVFWDAALDQNVTTCDHNDADNNLWEDIAVFGGGRFIFSVFHGFGNRVRRAWMRWEGSINVGPKHTLVNAYGSSPSGQNSFENVLMTWAPYCMPQTYVLMHNGAVWTGDSSQGTYSNYNVQNKGGVSGNEGNPGENLGTVMSGCLAYVKANDFTNLGSSAPNAYPVALAWHRYSNTQTFRQMMIMQGPGMTSASNILGWVLGDASGSNNSLDHATGVHTGANIIGSGWSTTNFVESTTIGGVPNVFSQTTGANLCHRWVNGVETSTPLWPWPMNDRIKAATGAAGAYSGPAGTSSSGGRFTRTATDVTADVVTLLGTIPSTCLGTTPPPPVPAPVAAFSASPTTGTAPLTVVFHDESLNTPTQWFWTFGDNSGSTLQNPTHIYTAQGSYDPALTVVNSSGQNTVSRFGYIVVNATPPTAPVASFTASPTSGNTPLSVQFTDTSTGTPTSWQWNFGDGTTATTQNPSHAYTAAGSYSVQLTATNAGGSTSITRTGLITATTPPPPPITPAVVDFVGTPTSGSAPCSVTFTNLTSNLAPTLTPNWAWTFDDGSCSTSVNPSHTYTACGSYTITLAVNQTDATSATISSSTCSRQNYITISPTAPAAPTAAFTGTPLSGTTPLTVQFTDASTNTPTSWAWSFGDGNCSTSQSPSHIYSAAGSYTVTLYATNASGTNGDQKVAYVAAAAPVPIVKGRGHGKGRKR